MDDRHLVALHESGHAVIAALFGAQVGIVSIEPTRSASGWVRYALPPGAPPHEHAAAYLSGSAAEYLAGRPGIRYWPVDPARLAGDGADALAVARGDRRWLAEVADWCLPLVDSCRAEVEQLASRLLADRWVSLA